MDQFEASFLETQQLQPLVWFRYIDDIFFIRTHDEEKCKIFLNSLHEFDPCIKFTYQSDKKSRAFLDIKVRLRNSKVFTDLHVKPTDRHQYLHYLYAHPYHTEKLLLLLLLLLLSLLLLLLLLFIKIVLILYGYVRLFFSLSYLEVLLFMFVTCVYEFMLLFIIVLPRILLSYLLTV